MKMLKSFSIYTFVGFFGAGINFFLMPLLSHYLTPSDFGITSIINTYVTLLFPILGMNAYGIISVEYYKTRDKKDFASLFSSVQFVPIIPTIIITAIGLMLYGRIAPLLELPPGELWVGIVIFLLSLLVIYLETGSAYLIIAKKARLYAITVIARVLVETSLTIWFVVFLKMGWKGRILSWTIATGIFALISFWIFYKDGILKGAIKKKFLYSSIAYGLPLVPHSIGKFVINQSDRLFIAKMISVAEAGIYSVGYNVGMVVMLFCTAFNNMFTPFLMERLSNLTQEKKAEIVRLSYLFLGIAVAALLLVNIFTPLFFHYLVDAKYARGASYVFWVSLGYFFWGCYLMFSGYLFFYKKTKIMMWISLVNVVTNLAFNYWFIKLFGGIGAAYATALSFLITFLLVIYQSNKLVKMPWFSKRQANIAS